MFKKIITLYAFIFILIFVFSTSNTMFAFEQKAISNEVIESSLPDYPQEVQDKLNEAEQLANSPVEIEPTPEPDFVANNSKKDKALLNLNSVQMVPSLTVTNVTGTSLVINVVYPRSGVYGNGLAILDKSTGKWRNIYDSFYATSGEYVVTDLKAANLYDVQMYWYTDDTHAWERQEIIQTVKTKSYTTSLSISDITDTSLRVDVVYPISGIHGNGLFITDKITNQLIDIAGTWSATDGSYTVSNLIPDRQYTIQQVWYRDHDNEWLGQQLFKNISTLPISTSVGTQYFYNSAGRLDYILLQNNQKIEYKYDANGNTLSRTFIKSGIDDTDVPPTTPAGNLYFDFESDNVQGWVPQGEGVLLNISQEHAYGGNKSLKVTNRTSTWHGPILNVKNNIEAQKSYQIKAFVRLPQGASASQVMMTIHRTMPNGNSYYDNISTKTVTSNGWATLEGIYQLNEPATSMYLYLESASPNVSFFLDNVSIEAYSAEPAPLVHDFEDGTTQGWYAQGEGVLVANTQEAASSGSHSLKISNRSAEWQGPVLDLTSYMKKGQTYTLSGKLRLPQGVTASDILLTMNRTDENGLHYYDNVSASHVTVDGWVDFEGVYTFTGTVAGLNIYMESPNATASFYLDDFKVEKYVEAAPVVSHDFEDETLQGWVAQGRKCCASEHRRNGKWRSAKLESI